MYAIVRSGGKQYRVSVGDQLLVEKLPAQAGEQIVLDEVLLVAGEEGVRVGVPIVEGARVRRRYWARRKAPKSASSSTSRRSAIAAARANRQTYTRLRVEESSFE